MADGNAPSAIFLGRKKMEDRPQIKAIIGLGNPGSQYENNRHNIGFRVVDLLAARYGAEWLNREKLEYTQFRIEDQPVILIKPQTFMNSSGQVIPFLQKRGIEPAHILVVHDELEKPFGKLSLRFGGSHRGHNGLRSIIASCGADFWRLRFGIGRPAEKEQVAQYVLSDFRESHEQLSLLVEQAADMIEELFR